MWDISSLQNSNKRTFSLCKITALSTYTATYSQNSMKAHRASKSLWKCSKIAKGDGISGMVATPHVLDGVYDNSIESIGKAVART